MSRNRLVYALKIAVGCAAVVGSLKYSTATAGTEIEGHLGNVQIRAENTSTAEVLSALASKFKVTYKLQSHPTRELNIIYSGTLKQVLARILDGTDYILDVSDSGINVVVLGESRATAGAVQTIARPAEANAAPIPAASPISPAPASAPASVPTAAAIPAVNVGPVVVANSSSPPPLAAYLAPTSP